MADEPFPVAENPRTGERVEFLAEAPELLVMRTTWPRPGHRALEHVHPRMEERFEVLEGRAIVRIGGDEHHLNVGDVAVAPPGVRHLAWNPTDDPVVLRLEMRPALRWRELTTRLFAGEDAGALLEQFADEVVLPPPDGG